ncbi:hypothetical protein HAX54_039174, partial [Datura stramonium]|nr:hypothetical protein [Datura stramonium]
MGDKEETPVGEEVVNWGQSDPPISNTVGKVNDTSDISKLNAKKIGEKPVVKEIVKEADILNENETMQTELRKNSANKVLHDIISHFVDDLKENNASAVGHDRSTRLEGYDDTTVQNFEPIVRQADLFLRSNMKGPYKANKQ